MSYRPPEKKGSSVAGTRHPVIVVSPKDLIKSDELSVVYVGKPIRSRNKKTLFLKFDHDLQLVGRRVRSEDVGLEAIPIKNAITNLLDMDFIAVSSAETPEIAGRDEHEMFIAKALDKMAETTLSIDAKLKSIDAILSERREGYVPNKVEDA